MELNPERSLQNSRKKNPTWKSNGSVFTALPRALTALILSKWDKMSFHVGSTSALVVKTTQLSLWLKLAWTLKRNCFYERKTFSVSLHFSLMDTLMSRACLAYPWALIGWRTWKKHLLVMGGHGHQRPNSPHTHSNRHKLHMRLCTFALFRVGSAMKAITK